MARLIVFRERDGSWRWLYTAEGVDLLSNEGYESREEAESAARTSYPGVVVEVPTAVDESVSRTSRRGLDDLPAPAAVALALLVLLLLWRSRRKSGRTPSGGPSLTRRAKRGAFTRGGPKGRH